MGFRGAVIMSVAGVIFFMVTINVLEPASIALLSLPALILAAFLVYAFRVRRRLATLQILTKKASNVINWSSAGEGIGILIAINVVKNIGHPDWIIPAVAFVVGLHFLPMAFALPFKLFYVLGALLMAGAIAGACLPYLPDATVAGLTAGLCLWIAAVLAIRREIHRSETAVVGFLLRPRSRRGKSQGRLASLLYGTLKLWLTNGEYRECLLSTRRRPCSNSDSVVYATKER